MGDGNVAAAGYTPSPSTFSPQAKQSSRSLNNSIAAEQESRRSSEAASAGTDKRQRLASDLWRHRESSAAHEPAAALHRGASTPWAWPVRQAPPASHASQRWEGRHGPPQPAWAEGRPDLDFDCCSDFNGAAADDAGVRDRRRAADEAGPHRRGPWPMPGRGPIFPWAAGARAGPGPSPPASPWPPPPPPPAAPRRGSGRPAGGGGKGGRGRGGRGKGAEDVTAADAAAAAGTAGSESARAGGPDSAPPA